MADIANFSFKRDWRAIQWGAALKMLFLRSFFTGLLFGLVTLITGPTRSQMKGIAMPLVIPLIMVPFMLCLLLAGKVASAIFGDLATPIFGFFSLIALLCIMPGGPILWLLRQNFPTLLPLEKFGFFNFKAVIFVLDPTSKFNLPPA